MNVRSQLSCCLRAPWLVLLLFAVATLVPAGIQAEGLTEDFAANRAALQRQLRSRQLDERLKALDKLRAYPVGDAARMASRCFVDSEREVREMAYTVLLSMNGEQEVCDALVDVAGKALHDKRNAEQAAPLLAVLLSSQSPIAVRSTNNLLDKTVLQSPAGPPVVITMVDSLASHGLPNDVLPLVRLSKSKIFSQHFGIRRSVVAALTKVPTKESVGALISMLDRVGGEARADAAEHLSKVTGQMLAMDAEGWSNWWKGAEATYVYPHTSQNGSKRIVMTVSKSGEYYGLPLFAERLVFVLDTSGSMSGGRLQAAQRELMRAISGLPEHVHFGVVVFNGRVHRWQKELLPANAKWKSAALLYIESQNAESNTASYDALEAALSYDTEAIYFLSDGAPTSGKILAPVDIVAAICQVNLVRRISVYTIGIAPGFPGSPTDAFLQTLAEKNQGQYRRIDN